MLCSGFEPGASHKIVGEEGYLSMSLVKKLSLCHLFLFVLFSIYISLSRSQKLWINKSPQAHITHINTHFLFLSFLLNFFLLPFHLLGIRYFFPLLVSVSLSRSIPTFTNFYSLHILSLSLNFKRQTQGPFYEAGTGFKPSAIHFSLVSWPARMVLYLTFSIICST